MANYEVGYGKPSKAVQFKKGISGNPRGRPIGKRSLITVLQQTLHETVVIEENGKKRTVTNLEAAIRRLVNSATAGDEPPCTLSHTHHKRRSILQKGTMRATFL